MTPYRGYRILTQLTKEWFANIFRPGSNRVMTGPPHATATREEGEQVVIARARDVIDKEEAKSDEPVMPDASEQNIAGEDKKPRNPRGSKK